MTASPLTLLEPAETTHSPVESIQYDERANVAEFDNHLILSRSASRSYNIQQIVKRLLDIALASFGVAIFSPVLLVIALAVKISSPGPVFYKSLRIGQNYQPFYMFKFRTMEVDADAKRAELRQKANLQDNLFKLKNDPRVTPIGRLLRAYSLDELPQLLNVIFGQMSLVGPRPLPPDESQMFTSPYTLRFHIKPGLTGIWQVNGRSTLTFQNLCKLEYSYVLRWSLLEDLKILFKTVPVVLFRTGAY